MTLTLNDLRGSGRAVIRLWPDAGQLLEMSKDSIYGAAARGELPFVRTVGRRRLVSVPHLIEWLNGDPEQQNAARGGAASESSTGTTDGGLRRGS